MALGNLWIWHMKSIANHNERNPFFHVSFKTIECDVRFFLSYVLILIVTKFFLSYSFCIHVTLIKCKYTFIVSQLLYLAHTKLPTELDKINSTLVNIKVFFSWQSRRMTTYFSLKGFLMRAEITFTPLYNPTPLRNPFASRLRNSTVNSSVPFRHFRSPAVSSV